MLKRFWEWRVDGQVVSAKLSLLTGRETIAIDGTSVPRQDLLETPERGSAPIS